MTNGEKTPAGSKLSSRPGPGWCAAGSMARPGGSRNPEKYRHHLRMVKPKNQKTPRGHISNQSRPRGGACPRGASNRTIRDRTATSNVSEFQKSKTCAGTVIPTDSGGGGGLPGAWLSESGTAPPHYHPLAADRIPSLPATGLLPAPSGIHFRLDRGQLVCRTVPRIRWPLPAIHRPRPTVHHGATSTWRIVSATNRSRTDCCRQIAERSFEREVVQVEPDAPVSGLAAPAVAGPPAAHRTRSIPGATASALHERDTGLVNPASRHRFAGRTRCPRNMVAKRRAGGSQRTLAGVGRTDRRSETIANQ